MSPFQPRPLWFPYSELASHAPLRLYCFPYAGGGAAVYRPWIQALEPEIEVVPVQLPGREGRLREAPFRRMGALVDALVHHLSPAFAEKPFGFFGHSVGARIALELTRALIRRNLATPRALVASGCPSPHLKDSRPHLHRLPDGQLVQELRKLEGTPGAVLDNQELMALMLPHIRADYELSELYVPTEGGPLSLPIIALGGLNDPEGPPAALHGWRDETCAGFELRLFAGDHFFITTSFAEVTSYLRGRLTAMMQGSRREPSVIERQHDVAA